VVPSTTLQAVSVAAALTKRMGRTKAIDACLRAVDYNLSRETILAKVLRGHISARLLIGTWAEGEASDILAPFAGISYVVFASWDLGKPLSFPT